MKRKLHLYLNSNAGLVGGHSPDGASQSGTGNHVLGHDFFNPIYFFSDIPLYDGSLTHILACDIDLFISMASPCEVFTLS